MRVPVHTGLSILTKQITSTVSVALVLLILGIVASLGIVARNLTREVKENVGFVLSLNANVPEQHIDSLHNIIASSPYALAVTYTSAQQQLDAWAAEEQDSTMVALMTADPADNPFFPEFEVRVREQYASVDSINVIITDLSADPAVAETSLNADMAESIDKVMRQISYSLIAIAIVLLIIAIALINNTIRLTVYSQRFTIHTMQLVGATRGFIRRPIVWDNIMHGIVAALVSIGLLALLRNYGPRLVEFSEYLPWQSMWMVFGGMLLCGIIICAAAAIFATNKYLSQEYDEMF